MENQYLIDAGLFLQDASTKINNVMDKREVVFASLSFSLGLERLLKGVLFNVNPTYILEEPKFESSVKVLYGSKLIKHSESQKELSKTPNEDVITFKKSLLRAQSISETTFKYKHTLFYVSEIRDIIAHHELSKIEIEKIKLILQRDFYPIINDFVNEIKVISKKKYFQEHHIRLAKLSSKLQTDLGLQISLKLSHHKDIWTQRKKIEGYFDSKYSITKQILLTKNKFPINCPACDNTAIIYSVPIKEINISEKQDETIGLNITKIKCCYCKLEISEPDEIDFLDKKHKINIQNSMELKDTLEFMSAEDLESMVEDYLETQADIKRGK